MVSIGQFVVIVCLFSACLLHVSTNFQIQASCNYIFELHAFLVSSIYIKTDIHTTPLNISCFYMPFGMECQRSAGVGQKAFAANDA